MLNKERTQVTAIQGGIMVDEEYHFQMLLKDSVPSEMPFITLLCAAMNASTIRTGQCQMMRYIPSYEIDEYHNSELKGMLNRTLGSHFKLHI